MKKNSTENTEGQKKANARRGENNDKIENEWLYYIAVTPAWWGLQRAIQ